MQKVEIYTDGSCLGNPGPGGWAYVFYDSKTKKITHEASGGEADTTNNRMELKAVINALKKMQKFSLHKCIIYSDSNLVVQTMNQGWKKKANIDLWLELEKIMVGLEVEFQWIKAHAKNKLNDHCDVLAKKSAAKFLRTQKKSDEVSTGKKPKKQLALF